MMNLFYEPLPDSVPVGGSDLAILTDFRDWLKFGDMLRDDELRPEDKLDLMRAWFVEPPDVLTAEMFQALRDFCETRALDREPDADADEEPAHPNRPPTFDWTMDAGCVIADFRRYYQLNLFSAGYLHWWEFLTLVRALPDESQTFRRISIRSQDLSKIKDPERRRALMEAQMRIGIPFEMDDYAIADAFDF